MDGLNSSSEARSNAAPENKSKLRMKKAVALMGRKTSEKKRMKVIKGQIIYFQFFNYEKN